MRGFAICAVLGLLGCMTAQRSSAHALRLGYLAVTQLDATRLQLDWRATDGGAAPRIMADGRCKWESREAAALPRRILQCPGGPNGVTLALDSTSEPPEVIAEVAPLGRQSYSTLLAGDRRELEIVLDRPTPARVLSRYLSLGVAHVLGGADHVLFLTGLLFLARRVRNVLVAASMFTLGHSVTLSLAVLGLLRFDAHAAEACIALSLIIMAREILRRRGTSCAAGTQSPADVPGAGDPDDPDSSKSGLGAGLLGVVLVFGLVHGLGFASSLATFDVPREGLVPALLGFNLGVEAGQILLLGAGWIVVELCSRRAAMARALRPAWAYVIGSMGAFWLIERF